MYRLSGSEYAEVGFSGVLSELAAAQLTEFLDLGKSMNSVAWSDEVVRRFLAAQGGLRE